MVQFLPCLFVDLIGLNVQMEVRRFYERKNKFPAERLSISRLKAKWKRVPVCEDHKRAHLLLHCLNSQHQKQCFSFGLKESQAQPPAGKTSSLKF